MPVIRISDATFEDLQLISTWLETGTPPQTIERIVQDKMNELGLARDGQVTDQVVIMDSPPQEEAPMRFEQTPGLSHTRLLASTIDGEEKNIRNWNALLVSMVAAVKKKSGLAGAQLVVALQFSARVGSYDREGYKYHAPIGISIPGRSADNTWAEVKRLARRWRIPVEIRFQWRGNPKAQHPGKTGLLQAGPSA